MAYWCAARLQLRREALALHCLGLAGFTTYLPRLREYRTSHGRRVEVRPPLFPGYCFLQITLQWHAAQWAPGTCGLIMDGDRPAKVADAVIAEIRSRERGGLIELPKPPPLRRPTTTWLWTELKRLGLPVICIDARHAKAVLKMQINKSDRNDAAGIARIMQTGWFKEVRVKGLDSHTVKALQASRALLVKIKRDLENQIGGLLRTSGSSSAGQR